MERLFKASQEDSRQSSRRNQESQGSPVSNQYMRPWEQRHIPTHGEPTDQEPRPLAPQRSLISELPAASVETVVAIAVGAVGNVVAGRVGELFGKVTGKAVVKLAQGKEFDVYELIGQTSGINFGGAIGEKCGREVAGWIGETSRIKFGGAIVEKDGIEVAGLIGGCVGGLVGGPAGKVVGEAIGRTDEMEGERTFSELNINERNTGVIRGSTGSLSRRSRRSNR